MFIVNNIEMLIDEIPTQSEELEQCNTELAEQGVLDVLFRIAEMIYYKMTPPIMF